MSGESERPQDGGPAFPTVEHRPGDPQVWDGMTLRDYAAIHAPAQEIQDMIGETSKWCADYLGMPPEEYKGPTHYRLVLSKARYMWADAMLAERAKSTEVKA